MKRLWQDTDPDTEAELIRRLRDASPARRFEIADALTFSVVLLSRQALARKRPDASVVEILLEWVGLHYGPDLEREASRQHGPELDRLMDARIIDALRPLTTSFEEMGVPYEILLAKAFNEAT